MHLDVQLVARPSRLDALVHQRDGRPRVHHVEQLDDVLGVQAHTPVADPHPDAVGLVGSVNQVGRQPQVQRVGPERVVRTGPDHARQNLTAPSVVLAHRFWRIPCRKRLLANHGGLPERRLPADPADADGPCMHHGSVLRIVVDPHLGEIDHHPGAGRIGKDEPGGNPDGRPLAGKPDVGAGIGEAQLRNPHPESPGDVEQRVLVPADVDRGTADHGLVRGQLPGTGERGGGRDRRRQDECETPPLGETFRGSGHGAPFQCPSPRRNGTCRCITDGHAIQRHADIHELPPTSVNRTPAGAPRRMTAPDDSGGAWMTPRPR